MICTPESHLNYPPASPGGSERAQSQLFRALRYHTLRDPQLHNTLKDLLTAVRAPGKGLRAAARIYLSRREFPGGSEVHKHTCPPQAKLSRLHV